MDEKALFGALLLALSCGQAEAQEPKTEAYICKVEFTGGLAYDVESKSWRSTTFQPKGKFIFRVKSAKTETEKIGLRAVNYEATVTEAGRNREVSCAGGKDKTTSADQDGTLDCATALYEYKFNLKNNRFLRAYLAGYVNGLNENSDTPGVSGGTCTKMD
jgi:hypothetical protein